MTPKRVRFAETNILYSPPPTPSPTFSEESLPSSSGPLTPSPVKLDSSPLQAAECVPVSSELVFIHPIIGFDQNPPIEHDLNLHPSHITTTTLPCRPLSPYYLSQPATTPPLPTLHLIAHNFPWTITIKASSDDAVTVLDVLSILYRTLRLPVTPDEFQYLPSSDDMLRVNVAYEDRYNAIADQQAREVEKRKGVKRVDFLAGRKFLGLSSTTMGPNFWVINVARREDTREC